MTFSFNSVLCSLQKNLFWSGSFSIYDLEMNKRWKIAIDCSTAGIEEKQKLKRNPFQNTCLHAQILFLFSLRFRLFSKPFFHLRLFHGASCVEHTQRAESPLKMNEVIWCSCYCSRGSLKSTPPHHIPDPILKSKVFFSRLLFVLFAEIIESTWWAWS